MNTNGTYQHADPERAHVRDYVQAVQDGGPGGTYGPSNGRYVVGGVFTAVVIPAHYNRHARLREALKFVGQYDSTHTFGYWKDGQGRYWLDVVETFQVEKFALMVAQKRGELAIYDREEDREIVV